LWCNICRNEFEDSDGICPACGTNFSTVQILPPGEREDFNGMTIEQDNGERNNGRARASSPYQKVFVFNSTSAGPLTKLLLNILLLLAVIVFLPLVLLFAATFGLSRLGGRGRQ